MSSVPHQVPKSTSMKMNDRKRPRSLSANLVDGKNRAKRSRNAHGDLIAWPPDLATKLEATPPQSDAKIKYRNYIEIVENFDKKKKLVVEHTFKRTPPTSYEFLPIGNPKLSTCCKELSRHEDLIVYIVSVKLGPLTSFSPHMWRIGHHFHSAILYTARCVVPSDFEIHSGVELALPIPEIHLYHRQVNAIIQDLFPRIPNIDRQMILRRAFTVSARPRSAKPVGLQEDVPLYRRVQLAVIAHIRHTQTDYDRLMTEMSWTEARAKVRPLCVQILFDWRGDDETGRDQVDRYARDWVFIGSDETESSVKSPDSTSSDEESVQLADRLSPQVSPCPDSNRGLSLDAAADKRTVKEDRRGFKRYHQAWDETVRRHRDAYPSETAPLCHAYGQDRDYKIWLDNGSSSQPFLGRIGYASTAGGYVPQDRQMLQNMPGNASDPDIFTAWPQVQGAWPDSIKPVFPAYQRPSLSPSVPPGARDYMEHYLRASWQYSISGPSFPAQQPWHEEHDLSGRLVIGRHGPLQDKYPGNFQQAGQFRFVKEHRQQETRMPEVLRLVNPRPNQSTRARESATANQPTRADRTVVNVSRPGIGANHVIMENRGGFF